MAPPGAMQRWGNLTKVFVKARPNGVTSRAPSKHKSPPTPDLHL